MPEIKVRHSEPADAKAVKAIYTCKNAYTGTLQLPYPSDGIWEKRVGNTPDNVYSLVAELDGKIVGNLGMVVEPNARRRHVAGFGMGVHDDYQGQGVGTALVQAALELADDWLNLKRLELTVFCDNRAAIALYEKHGFVIEGEAKDYAFRAGEYVSVYFMARIR